MQFKELTEEEASQLTFASGRQRTTNSPYADLLKAVKAGKKVLVELEKDKTMRHLKWGISQAAKRADIQIEMKVLDDQSGVVVSLVSGEHAPEPASDTAAAETTPAGRKSRT